MTLTPDTMIVSTSGGLTSMMMAAELKRRGHNLICIFANTGLENDETLDFVDECDRYFGLNIIWLEAVTDARKGKGVRHRVTNYTDAFRFKDYKYPDHPFHAHVRKNGIPNRVFKQCSDRLKEHVIEHYKKVNKLTGLPHAIGIRSDESHRATPTDISKILKKVGVYELMYHNAGVNRFEHILTNPNISLLDKSELTRLEAWSGKLSKYNLCYPLCYMYPADKTDVELYWEDQPFTLNLEGYQGNCRSCFKKSNNKLHLIAKETPDAFEAMAWFEKEYGFVKATDDGKPRVSFRGNRTAEMIIGDASLMDRYELRKLVGVEPAIGDDGCSQSCNGYLIE